MKVLVATDLLASMLLHKDYVDGMDILFMWFRKLRIACYMDISSLMVLTHFTGAEQLQMLHDFRLIKEIPPTTDNIQILKKTYVNKDVGLNNIGEKRYCLICHGLIVVMLILLLQKMPHFLS